MIGAPTPALPHEGGGRSKGVWGFVPSGVQGQSPWPFFLFLLACFALPTEAAFSLVFYIVVLPFARFRLAWPEAAVIVWSGMTLAWGEGGLAADLGVRAGGGLHAGFCGGGAGSGQAAGGVGAALGGGGECRLVDRAGGGAGDDCAAAAGVGG